MHQYPWKRLSHVFPTITESILQICSSNIPYVPSSTVGREADMGPFGIVCVFSCIIMIDLFLCFDSF